MTDKKSKDQQKKKYSSLSNTGRTEHAMKFVIQNIQYDHFIQARFEVNDQIGFTKQSDIYTHNS